MFCRNASNKFPFFISFFYFLSGQSSSHHAQTATILRHHHAKPPVHHIFQTVFFRMLPSHSTAVAGLGEILHVAEVDTKA